MIKLKNFSIEDKGLNRKKEDPNKRTKIQTLMKSPTFEKSLQTTKNHQININSYPVDVSFDC